MGRIRDRAQFSKICASCFGRQLDYFRARSNSGAIAKVKPDDIFQSTNCAHEESCIREGINAHLCMRSLRANHEYTQRTRWR